MSQSLQIANTILQQMGGRRLLVMVGADAPIGSADSLSFRFRARGADGINAVRVVYDRGADLYNMEFIKLRGINRTVVQTYEGVFCDQLEELFARTTGLATRL